MGVVLNANFLSRTSPQGWPQSIIVFAPIVKFL